MDYSLLVGLHFRESATDSQASGLRIPTGYFASFFWSSVLAYRWSEQTISEEIYSDFQGICMGYRTGDVVATCLVAYYWLSKLFIWWVLYGREMLHIYSADNSSNLIECTCVLKIWATDFGCAFSLEAGMTKVVYFVIFHITWWCNLASYIFWVVNWTSDCWVTLVSTRASYNA